jgi:hypothetical protein
MADRLRPLTAGETALLGGVFGARIDYAAMRISDGFGLSYIAAIALRQPHADAITLRRTIYFGHHHFPDFAVAPVWAQALLCHESTHVWQWKTLGIPRFLARYAREFAACGGDARAMYRYRAGEPFAGARLEGQAQMVQDYYEARAAGRETEALAASLAGTGFYGL